MLQAQGFFIQLGTTAAYINVSLSLYYLLVIKFKWPERMLNKYKLYFFVCPIVVGLAFAFAGLPFYTNSILWCNNGGEMHIQKYIYPYHLEAHCAYTILL